MILLRKLLLHFLSLLLFVSLLGAAASTAANLAFSKPAHVENWLSQSHIYDHFVNTVLQQAPTGLQTSVDGRTVVVPLDIANVQQSAEATFTPQLIQDDVNTILNSNYNWLEGKVPAPNFSIDLSQPKAAFATSIAQGIQAKLAALPKCSPAQLKQLGSSTFDVSTANCLPPNINPQTAAAAVSQQIAASSSFLPNTTITPGSLDPSQKTATKPYYQTLSWLPGAYHWAQILPILLGIVTVMLALAMVFVALTRRRGLMHVASTFLAAGITLVILKFLGSLALSIAEKAVFNQNSIGQIQQSLTGFMRFAEQYLTHLLLIFGCAYIGVAAVMMLAVFLSGKKRSKSHHTPTPPAITPEKDAPSSPQDVTPPSQGPVAGPTPTPPVSSAPPLPPRRPSAPAPAPRPAPAPPSGPGAPESPRPAPPRAPERPGPRRILIQ